MRQHQATRDWDSRFSPWIRHLHPRKGTRLRGHILTCPYDHLTSQIYQDSHQVVELSFFQCVAQSTWKIKEDAISALCHHQAYQVRLNLLASGTFTLVDTSSRQRSIHVCWKDSIYVVEDEFLYVNAILDAKKSFNSLYLSETIWIQQQRCNQDLSANSFSFFRRHRPAEPSEISAYSLLASPFICQMNIADGLWLKHHYGAGELITGLVIP